MTLTALRRKFKRLRPVLTERSRRVWAATEALALGHGGIGLVEKAVEKQSALVYFRRVNARNRLRADPRRQAAQALVCSASGSRATGQSRCPPHTA